MPSLTRVLRRPVTTAALLLAATVPMAPTAVADVAHPDGVTSQAAPRFCTSTDVFTPSNRIRTKIVRNSDGWSRTISSRYRKWVDCTARQMTPTMWCTTKLVDGFSGICITRQPKAAGTSPCANPRLDVRSVYFPRSGRLAITCVNEAKPGPGAVTRTDPRGDASPAKLDMLSTRVSFNDRITVRTQFRSVERRTAYLVLLDPGRRGGDVFKLEAQVRGDLSASGRLMHHAASAPGGQFTVVRCAGLRTSVDLAKDHLRISAPSRCLLRRAPLGRGIWVSLNSFALPIGPAGGDILPDDYSTSFRVPRG
jgi:hypothetical protein